MPDTPFQHEAIIDELFVAIFAYERAKNMHTARSTPARVAHAIQTAREALEVVRQKARTVEGMPGDEREQAFAIIQQYASSIDALEPTPSTH